MRVLNMIVQLRQLVSEGRTREVELFARVRPGDPWLFGKLDEAVIVRHKVRCTGAHKCNRITAIPATWSMSLRHVRFLCVLQW